MPDKSSRVSRAFAAAANQVAKVAGGPAAFAGAAFIVVVWRAGAAKNFFIGIEQLTEDQIDRMREICAATCLLLPLGALLKLL